MLCATSAISYIERNNVTVVGVQMKPYFELSDIQLGNLYSAFVLGYALFQFPAGVLADRFGPRRVLGVAMLLWGCFTILTALVGYLRLPYALDAFSVLVVVRFLLGITVSPTYPAAGRSIRRWVSSPRRAAANAVVITGIGVGMALTPPILVYFMSAFDWQKAVLLSSLPAFVMAITWLASAKNEATGEDGVESVQEGEDRASDQTPGQPRAPLLANKNLWLLTLSYSLQGYVFYVFATWFFIYLKEERHFKLKDSAWLAALPWLLTLVTTPLGGVVSDRLVRAYGHSWGRRLVPLLALSAAAVLLACGSRAADPYLAVGLLTVCQALVMSTEGAFWGSVLEISREHAGAGGGILNMGGNLGGFVAPTLTPLIAAHLGWVPALDLAAAIAATAGLVWLFISPGTLKSSLS